MYTGYGVIQVTMVTYISVPSSSDGRQDSETNHYFG